MLTIDELRSYVRDNAAFNKIFLEYEFSDTELALAITWMQEDALAVEPFIEGFAPSTMPKAIQLDGALARLFDSAAAGELRNQSNLAEQNIPIPVGENGIILERLAAKYGNRFEVKVNKYKYSKNLENGMAGLGSPYCDYTDSY